MATRKRKFLVVSVEAANLSTFHWDFAAGANADDAIAAVESARPYADGTDAISLEDLLSMAACLTRTTYKRIAQRLSDMRRKEGGC